MRSTGRQIVAYGELWSQKTEKILEKGSKKEQKICQKISQNNADK